MAIAGVPAHADDPVDQVVGDPGQTYPNLVPDVHVIKVENYRVVQTGIEPGRFLWFDTRAQNLGPVPLQLQFDEIQGLHSATVSQCVSWRLALGHACRAQERVGGFVWHEAHTHYHYEEFARYELRRLARDGRPDYSGAGLIANSDKVSFCLIDSKQARDDAWPTPFYATCLPTVQGISPGWTDVYSSGMEGQNLPIENLMDGTYALVVEMDYGNTLREVDDTDNVVEVTIEVTGLGTSEPQVAVRARRWPRPTDRGTTTTTTTTTGKKPKRDWSDR